MEKDMNKLIKVGVAISDITPEKSVYMAGLNENRKSKGVHDNLYVRTLFLDVNGSLLSISSLDLVGFFWDYVEDIRKIVKKEIQIDEERIIIASTHTHSGPDTIGIWGQPDEGISGLDKDYIKSIQQIIAKNIIQAYKNIQSASLEISTSEVKNISKNLRDAELTNNQVTIISAKDKQNKNIATVINFACHPEVLWSDNYLLTADFPYYLLKKVESELGGIAIFLNGDLGGMLTADIKENTFEEAERIGISLADAIVEANNKKSESLIPTEIIVKRKIIDFPLENPFFKDITVLNLIDRKLYDFKVRSEVEMIIIDKLCIITVPGEMLPALGKKIRDEYGSYISKNKDLTSEIKYKFIIGLCNDEIGYILQEEDFIQKKYSYEVTRSVGPKTGALILNALIELAR